MATYLVTGVAGFIASKVADLLLSSGHIVVGIDNLNDAYDLRLKEWRLNQLNNRPNFTFQRLDILDRSLLLGLFREHATENRPPFEAVINLAARAGVRPSVENPWLYFDTNATGTLNLLNLCREFTVPKFVLASTSSLYGANNVRPFSEDADTDLPLSPYAASKKAAETICYTYHYLYGIDITVVRYFTVYGPAGRPDMSLFRFVRWISEGQPVVIYGDGTQERDFTYIDDIARGTLAGLKPTGYQIINLGSDQPTVLNEAISLIEQLVGREAILDYQPPQAADVQATWANIHKAEHLLGWRPQVKFDEGLARLVEWYTENRAWARTLML